MLIGDYDPSNPEQPDLSNFLTAEDLQKLQDQIIAPIQNIYVDSINGNDTNNGTAHNPVKTLNKAQQLIKNEIPTVYIFLFNDNNQTYSFDNSFFLSKNNDEIQIRALDVYSDYNPVITVSLGREGGTDPAYPNTYTVGYMLTKNFAKVRIYGVDIKYPDNAVISDKYAEQLIQYCSDFRMSYDSKITLIDNAVLLSSIPNNSNNIILTSSSIIGTETSLLAKGNILKTNILPENEDNQEKWTTWLGSEQSVFLNISKDSTSNINGFGNTKIYSDCHVLYSNIIT